MPVPFVAFGLVIEKAPVDVRVLPRVTAVPLKVTPAAVSVLLKLTVPVLVVRDSAPLNVELPVVVILPALETVRLCKLVNVGRANAVAPLFNETLLVGFACQV